MWIRNPIVVLLAIVACGCGSGSPNRVKGTVTFNGHAVDGGAIVFYPVDAPQAFGKGGEILAGQYVLEGERAPKPGQYRVEIVWHKKTGRKIPSNDPPNTVDETVQVIPKNFNVKSTLTTEIKPGVDTYDFPLTAK